MIFGPVPLAEAAGSILAHSMHLKDTVLRKGRVLSSDDIAALAADGLTEVTVAQMETGDLGEDEAAAAVAEIAAGSGILVDAPFTGRCNLKAETDGLLLLAPETIEHLNRVNEAVTLATLRPMTEVRAGQIVATSKIVTYGVAASDIDRCREVAGDTSPVTVAAYSPLRTVLIQTTLPGLKPTIYDKATHTMRDRLTAIGSNPAHDLRCPHDPDSLTALFGDERVRHADVVLILGASAISDRRDVVPVALEAVGGTIDHLGMPVDPGHLTLLGSLGTTMVLGLPGSARSPRLHGFDFLLQRRAAGLPVTADTMTELGVGGLLKDIPGRPSPRDEPAPHDVDAPHIAGIVLAAGQSRRMGSLNKLLADIDGAPMVRHAADALLNAGVSPVVVVLGHEADQVRDALSGMPVVFAENPAFAEGLSTSLKAGLSAVPPDIHGAVIALGDMPGLAPDHIHRLIDAFEPDRGSVCVPIFNGKRGNPVLWDRRYFDEMTSVAGDVGARHLIGKHEDAVIEIDMADDAVLIDLDTPDALESYRNAKLGR